MPHSAWNTNHCDGGGSKNKARSLLIGRTEPSQNRKLQTAVWLLQKLPELFPVRHACRLANGPAPAQEILKSTLPSKNSEPPVVSPNAIVFDVPSPMSVNRVWLLALNGPTNWNRFAGRFAGPVYPGAPGMFAVFRYCS